MENQIKQKKAGRPIKHNGLTIILTIRMTKEDFDSCKQKAEQANISIASYIRNIARDGVIINTFSKESTNHRTALIGIANNLNQLVKLAHTYSLTNLEKEAGETHANVKEIIDYYKIKPKY